MNQPVVRKIIHIDMDAFYASVEQRDQPQLKGKPLVVGGAPSDRGVVASCSYEARKFGVRSAMSSSRAASLCPTVIFVRPRMERYISVSREIRKIFHSVTDLVEPLSLDEAYLDVSTNKIGETSATRIAMHVRERIEKELNLTASAGIGPNKFIAKVASDIRKPNGLTVIPPDKVKDFVATLPIERFWGVGPATAKRLHERGIKTGSDLRTASLAELTNCFGKFGVFLKDLSEGIDHREVSPDREPKSRGSETTFSKDILDLKTLEGTITELAEDVAQSLDKLGRGGSTITLKVKYADFSQITRSKTLDTPVKDTKTISQTAAQLLRTATEAGHRPIRLIGVSVKLPSSDPPESDGAQLDLEL